MKSGHGIPSSRCLCCDSGTAWMRRMEFFIAGCSAPRVLQLCFSCCCLVLISKVLIHQEHGHQGMERITALLRSRYYWPGMSSDVSQWCQTCENRPNHTVNPVKQTNLNRQSANTMPALTGDTVRCINPAFKKQSSFKTFQTVNHAKVIGDPKLKPRGLIG